MGGGCGTGLPPIVGCCLRASVRVCSELGAVMEVVVVVVVLLGGVVGWGGFQREPTPPLCQFLSPPMQESSGIEPVAY